MWWGASSFPVRRLISDLRDMDDPQQILEGDFYNVDYTWMVQGKARAAFAKGLPAISTVLSFRIICGDEHDCADRLCFGDPGHRRVLSNDTQGRSRLMVTAEPTAGIDYLCDRLYAAWRADTKLRFLPASSAARTSACRAAERGGLELRVHDAGQGDGRPRLLPKADARTVYGPFHGYARTDRSSASDTRPNAIARSFD